MVNCEERDKDIRYKKQFPFNYSVEKSYARSGCKYRPSLEPRASSDSTGVENRKKGGGNWQVYRAFVFVRAGPIHREGDRFQGSSAFCALNAEVHSKKKRRKKNGTRRLFLVHLVKDGFNGPSRHVFFLGSTLVLSS